MAEIVKVKQSNKTLCKIPKFYLTLWSKDFVDKHCFHRALSDPQNTCFSAAFHTRKLGKILVFYGP